MRARVQRPAFVFCFTLASSQHSVHAKTNPEYVNISSGSLELVVVYEQPSDTSLISCSSFPTVFLVFHSDYRRLFPDSFVVWKTDWPKIKTIWRTNQTDADMSGRPSSNWFLLPVTTVVLVGLFCLSTLHTGNNENSPHLHIYYYTQRLFHSSVGSIEQLQAEGETTVFIHTQCWRGFALLARSQSSEADQCNPSRGLFCVDDGC